MKLARLTLFLLSFAGIYALIFFGGDLVAEVTSSRLLAGLVGLALGTTFYAVFSWTVKRLPEAAGAGKPTEDLSDQDEPEQMGTAETIGLLSLAVILALASIGYSGTPTAFLAGLMGGLLLARLMTWASRN